MTRKVKRPWPLGLSAAVALFAALTVLGVGVWQIHRSRVAILRDAEENIQNLCRSLAQHAGRTIEAVDLALIGAVELLEDPHNTTSPSDYLRRRAAVLAQARNLIVTDAQGAWRDDVAPGHGPISSADRDYFQRHRDHADQTLHVDQPIIGRTSGKLGIPLSRRISAPDGSFAGIAVATLAPEYFEQFYRSVKTGPHGAIALWMEDGRLLLRYPAISGSSKMDPSLLQLSQAKAFAAGSGVRQSFSPIDGVERLLAFEHVDALPLVVTAAVSVEDVLVDWRREAIVQAFVVGGATLALAILGLGLEMHRRRIRSLHEASREADRQYRLLAENSHDLIALKPSFGGERAYVSPSSRTIVGWEPHELAGLATEIFVHPDDLPAVQANFAALTADNPVLTNQHRVKHKAGHYLWVESVFRRTHDGSVLVSARDISERREAEQALAKSEKRFRSLADASSDMIQLLDLSGHLRYASPAAREILGQEPDELIGTDPVDAVHPEDAERVRDLMAVVISGQTDRASSVHRIRAKAGHWLWVDVQSRLVRDSDTNTPLEIVSNLRDVTEREAMRCQLEEANRLLRLGEEIAQVGHWRIELPSQALTWSEGTYRIHGADATSYRPTVETAIGLYHPDDRAHIEHCVAEALVQRQSYEFQARVQRPDGEVRHVLSRGLCQVEASGEMTAVFGTIIDITELRKAELAALESETRYRLLADNSSDMITYTDLTGRRLFVSPGARDLVGYEPEELIGTLRTAFVHPDDEPGVKRKIDELMTGRTNRVANINRVRHKNGWWIWIEASIKLLRDAQGQPCGFVSALRDITDRKLADEAMRASEARYRVLAEATTDLIMQLDLSMRPQYVSPACRHVLGFEPDELLGQQSSEHIHPDDVGDVRALAARLVSGEIDGGRAAVTYRTRHKAGHWLWVEAGLNLVRHEATGAPVSIICSLRDVTQRQRTARHLERAKAAAEQASRMKADFVANMSHELRTPLTGILGVHDLLRQDMSLGETQRRLVELASHAGTSLLAIVNDVLDFSKIEAGQLTIEAVPFNLDDLVEGCRELALKDLKGKPIEVRAVLHPAAPRRLVGDPTRLRQVLLNLLTNAVKFTERGAIVVRVGYSFDTGVLGISVSDTGIGIPPDRAAHLFDRFTQADTSMTRRFGGTGLGLAICKRLTELMGGSIGAEAVPQGGSCFWFEVPLEAREQADGPDLAGSGGPPLRGGRRLLLAEDHAMNAEIIGAMLTARGHRVTAVPNGAEALDAIRDGAPFDLVLMDVQMPVMDGITATAAIRAFEAGAAAPRLPIIGLTANALAEDAANCIAAGMDAHVAKPVVWDHLFATIDQLLLVPA